MGCGECKEANVEVYLDIESNDISDPNFKQLLLTELRDAYDYTEHQAQLLLDNIHSSTPILIYSGGSDLAIRNIQRFAINGIKTFARNKRLLK